MTLRRSLFYFICIGDGRAFQISLPVKKIIHCPPNTAGAGPQPMKYQGYGAPTRAFDFEATNSFPRAGGVGRSRKHGHFFCSSRRIDIARRKHSSISGSPQSDEAGHGEANGPVCRIVATSDGKIPPSSSFESLSPSSRSLLEKIELLYAAQSQKELRDLVYVMPRSSGDETRRSQSSSFNAKGNNIWSVNMVPGTFGGFDQEEKLVSVLKRSLEVGGFRLMDRRDLDLCSALNAAYLLRLSLIPDVKELDPCVGKEFYPDLYGGSKSSIDGSEIESEGNKDETPTNMLLFDGRVLVFRRGYSEEITTGRLLLPKLDYLQASLVQRSSTALTRRLGKFEQRLEDYVMSLVSQFNRVVQNTSQNILLRCRHITVSILERFGLSNNETIKGLAFTNDDVKHSDDSPEQKIPNTSQSRTSRSNFMYNISGNKIFKLGRYRTPISSLIPDSIDLNDALSPFLLCEVGGTDTTYTVERDIYDGIDSGKISCQYDDALFSQSSTLNQTTQLKPEAVRLLERVSIQNTVELFSKKGRRDLVKNYFKSSMLVEPAYEEVVVIWRPIRKTKPVAKRQLYPPKWLYEMAQVFDMEDRLPKLNNETQCGAFDEEGPMPIEIKAFYDVPMANIEAVLPKTRLVFRPADAIVFDLVSVVSFLAVAGSLKFDSPNLDIIALVSLAFFAVRTFFRYSNKYARYDLLVNKFLTSKISHRGPGALKYIVSEANSNQALRAMLIRDWLLKADFCSRAADGQPDNAALKQGKSYVNEVSSIATSQIDVDVLAALDDLKHLGLIDENRVKDEQNAEESVKTLWHDCFE